MRKETIVVCNYFPPHNYPSGNGDHKMEAKNCKLYFNHAESRKRKKLQAVLLFPPGILSVAHAITFLLAKFAARLVSCFAQNG